MRNTLKAVNRTYATTIFALVNLLSNRKIPLSISFCWDGLQIRFPWNHGDIICHSGSYGHDQNCVESMGCPWDDDDVTCLSLEEAYNNIVAWYEEYEGLREG